MILSNVRTLIVACSVGGAFLATPSESKAIFHLFGGGCCGARTAYSVPTTAYYAPTTTYYAPTTAYYAPACNTCVQQVANYVPQTCYRTQYVNVPVTAYQPVVAADPCTGCPVTVMRPVTSYVRQVQMVPYTTYRIAYSPIASSCCTTTAYYAPAVYSPAACCAPAAPACCAPAASVVPSSPAAPATPGVEGDITPQPELNLRVPVPAPAGENSTQTAPTSAAPRLIDPDARVTARPIPRVGVNPISLPQNARQAAPATQRAARPASAAERIADDGWRQSSR